MPLFRVIIEELLNKPQGITVRELMNIIKREYGIETAKNELYATLLKLEVAGFIRVEHVGAELIVKVSPEFINMLKREIF